MEDELAQAVIEEAFRRPKHRREVTDNGSAVMATNPLCGDEVTVALVEGEEGVKALFDGQGCAISLAGAELLCGLVDGSTKEEATGVASALKHWLEGGAMPDGLGKAEALGVIMANPDRIRCATLGCEAVVKLTD